LKIWLLVFLKLAGVLALGLVFGLFTGEIALCLLIALLAYTAHRIWKLHRLVAWLRARNYSDPPSLGGMWDEIVTEVLRLNRRKRFHKRRLVAMLHEVRDSTAALPDGVVLLNARGEIVRFNRMAAQMLDLHGRKDIGIRIDNLLRQPEFVKYLAGSDFSSPKVLQTGTAPESWLSLHVLPYGEGQRVLLIRDVTRHVRLEAMRKDFVANASHELRSPLTVITGYLETLAGNEQVNAQFAAPIDEMRRQADRMAAIIGDLLVLSRLEAKEGEVEGEEVDVAAMLALLRKEAIARPVRPASVTLAIDSDSGLWGDDIELHSAFANLLDNAVKYTPPEGSVAMRWWTDEAGAHFSVTDTGPGIPAEAIPRLTERFYRVDIGRSRATGGSGLGLAIVKHVLQRHGGHLDVASVEGRGSTFTCHFPLRRIARPVAGSNTAR